jgi:hypothetical protein
MYTFDFGCRRSRRRRRKSDPDVLSIIARLRAAARALSRAAAIRGYNTPSGGLLFTILSAPRQPLKGGTASLAVCPPDSDLPTPRPNCQRPTAAQHQTANLAAEPGRRARAATAMPQLYRYPRFRAIPTELARWIGDYALHPAAPLSCPRRAGRPKGRGGASDANANHDFHRDELGGESMRSRRPRSSARSGIRRREPGGDQSPECPFAARPTVGRPAQPCRQVRDQLVAV